MKKLQGEIGRFIVVGLLTVGLDFICYLLLLHLTDAVVPSKIASFLLGGLFSYAANKHFTFRVTQGGSRLLRSYAVFLVSLAVNSAINYAILLPTERGPAAIVIAFVIATGVSATMNFIGMRYWVFARTNVPAERP